METETAHEHLPAWMRQPRRSFDWGLVLAALMGLTIAWAFFVRSGVSAYSDLVRSGFMVSDLAEALREGQIYPRWSPHSFGGYGAPIPNFVPQGAPFAAALAAQLFTGDTDSAVRLVMAAALVFAATAQYGFCRRWLGPSAALAAAGLYAFSPVLGLTAPHVAGDLTGVAGMAIMPSALWVTSRLVQDDSGRDVPIAACAFAGLMYVHPGLAAASAAIGLALAAGDGFHAMRRVVVSQIAAAGLFAPFWIPALAEAGSVRWLPGAPAHTELTLASLFAPVGAIDPILLNPAAQYTLGIPLSILSAAGIAYALTRKYKPQFTRTLIAAAVGSGLLAVLAQAPWLTYVMAMSCATLGGLALEWRKYAAGPFRPAVLPVLLILIAVFSSNVWLSPLGPVTGDFTALAQVEFERDGLRPANLPARSPVPSSLPEGLPRERNLVDLYRFPPVQRFGPGSTARATPLNMGSHSFTWQVSVSDPTEVTLSLAYSPAWQASLSGAQVGVSRDPSTGLVRLALPAAANDTLRVYMGATSAQLLGWTVFAVAVGGLALWGRYNPGVEPASQPQLAMDVSELRLAAFAVIAMGLTVVSIAVPGGAFDLRPDPFSSFTGSTPAAAEADTIRLLAYRLGADHASPGDIIPLSLFWSASAAPEANYQIQVLLFDAEAERQAELTQPTVPGDLPTRRWLAGYAVADDYMLRIPAELEPGEYRIGVTAYACDEACNLAEPLEFRGAGREPAPRAVLSAPLYIGGQ